MLVGAISVNRPSLNFKQVVPLAHPTSDYMVLVVPADSPCSVMAASLRRSFLGLPSLYESSVRTELTTGEVFWGGGLSLEQGVAMDARIALAVKTPAGCAALALRKEYRDTLPIEQGIADAVTLMPRVKVT